MFTLVQIPIGWCAKTGVTALRIRATKMVISTSSRLSTMVLEIVNAKVTYSVKQLTAGCVDDTSFHFGFIVDNEYNIWFRTV